MLGTASDLSSTLCAPSRTYPYTPFRIYCYNGRTKYVPKNTSSAVGSSQTLPFHRAVTNGHVVHPDSAVSFARMQIVDDEKQFTYVNTDIVLNRLS